MPSKVNSIFHIPSFVSFWIQQALDMFVLLIYEIADVHIQRHLQNGYESKKCYAKSQVQIKHFEPVKRLKALVHFPSSLFVVDIHSCHQNYCTLARYHNQDHGKHFSQDCQKAIAAYVDEPHKGDGESTNELKRSGSELDFIGSYS